VTEKALAELVKELTDVTGPRPVTAAELASAKDGIIRGYAAKFADNAAVATTLNDLVVYDLPDDEFATYRAKVEAVTLDGVNRAAKKYLDPSRMTILVVGDRAKVEGPLKTLPFAKVIRFLDAEGNQVPAAASGSGQATGGR
jgi:zinc protease